MNNTSSIYDWIIVGGGISGISIAEILCREGKSVLLLEKNSKLASETSKEFHEWVHSGALYTLVPDNLLTLRYLLGATDDVIEFYSSFSRMNLTPTESGIRIDQSGWFNDDRIEYRYRTHKFNPIWLSLVSRSISLIHMISEHDWLRRRAGSEYGSSKVKLGHSFRYIGAQLLNSSKFYSIMSPDFTMNSRMLISDILSAAVTNGLEVLTDAPVDRIDEKDNFVEVGVSDKSVRSKNIALCSPDAISKFLNVPMKTGYAPMAVIDNVPEEETSFVELDYQTKKCINLLKKENGIGQIGGITLNQEKEVKDYLSYIISEHKKRNPSIRVVDSYVGLKKELVQKGQNRNYLYHIQKNSSKIWSVVLGKFTLAFSMAPEFYRRAYHKNPAKLFDNTLSKNEHNLLSKTTWQEIIEKDNQ